jgi:hypothetical protein
MAENYRINANKSRPSLSEIDKTKLDATHSCGRSEVPMRKGWEHPMLSCPLVSSAASPAFMQEIRRAPF